MQLFVGSTNPVKVNAVTLAATETWPEVRVTSCDVPSGISPQPRSDAETRAGARNRAVAALEEGISMLRTSKKKIDSNDILGVGLEGGVFDFDSELWSTVWVCVVDMDTTYYESNGARFRIPERIAREIRAGGEMGPIMNAMYNGTDIKRTTGAIGIITNNFVDRTEEYSAIAKMALGLWYGREWEKHLR